MSALENLRNRYQLFCITGDKSKWSKLDMAVLQYGVEKAAEELASMQARIAELERMVVGIDTMRNNPKGCQFVAVYNLSGELADVVEISGTPAMTTITTPTKLAK